MAIAIDLLIIIIFWTLGNTLSIYLSISDELCSIYLLFYEQEHIVLGNVSIVYMVFNICN